MAKKIETFGHRHNAKRAAERAIAAGSAPSIDYGIKEHQSGRFEIVWHHKGAAEAVATTESNEAEIAPATAAAADALEEETLPEPKADDADPFPKGTRVRVAIAGQISRKKYDLGTVVDRVGRSQWRVVTDGGALPEYYTCGQLEADAQDTEVAHQAIAEIEEPDTDNHVDKEGVADDHREESEPEVSMPDLFPPGTRVIVQVSARKRRSGAVEYRVDATSCRVKFDGPHPSVLCRYNQLSLDDGSEPALVPKKTERRKTEHQRGDRKPSKSAELDAAAARGEMPAKPIITSKANQEQYQKRFDKLEASALAGDWDAVRGYEVKGINSYAKMVKQYRDRLLIAHAASAERSSEAA